MLMFGIISSIAEHEANNVSNRQITPLGKVTEGSKCIGVDCQTCLIKINLPPSKRSSPIMCIICQNVD